MKRLAAILLLVAFAISFCSCGDGKSEKEIFAMDTYMRLTVYGKDADSALEKAAEKITELDGRFSVSSVTGELETLISDGKLNSPSAELIEMLTCAKILYERTGGAYDITAYALSQLWKKCESEGRAPTESEISEARALVGMDKISFDKSQVLLNGVRGIDLGSIAKGYAGREAASVLKSEGVSGGILTLGGNVVTFGEKPDGKPFKIGITDPNAPETVCGYVTVGASNVVTSGKYNRNFTVDGRVYHHILDVKTGYPCENGIASVTVICDDGMWADALSTALFLIGKDAALEYYRTYGGFEAVIITDSGEITVTDGLTGSFSAE
ncbi:MAG: FAD:protein FMN transferase [Clostridia bacterium]|nr:FAD:protein FMN transferase [Clostridia bacterium]